MFNLDRITLRLHVGRGEDQDDDVSDVAVGRGPGGDCSHRGKPPFCCRPPPLYSLHVCPGVEAYVQGLKRKYTWSIHITSISYYSTLSYTDVVTYTAGPLQLHLGVLHMLAISRISVQYLWLWPPGRFSIQIQYFKTRPEYF